MMDYKGYLGRVEFDVITFEGESVKELQQAFRDSVDDYLEFCKSRGEAPDKPFSGQFVARIPPDLHREVSLAAASVGQSLNAWVTETLQSALGNRTPNRAADRSKTPKPRRVKARTR